MNKDTTPLIGRTIKSIDSTACNCWNVYFDDGTSISIWAEIDGPLGMGQLWLDESF